MIVGRLWAVLISLTALLAVGCSGHPTPSTGQPVQGGVATFAEPANTTPNYIFPFMSTEYFSVTTISDLQYLMYRPLYWFGDNGQPVLNDKPKSRQLSNLLRQQPYRDREAAQLHVV